MIEKNGVYPEHIRHCVTLFMVDCFQYSTEHGNVVSSAIATDTAATNAIAATTSMLLLI